jgi:hypothetical protein
MFASKICEEWNTFNKVNYVAWIGWLYFKLSAHYIIIVLPAAYSIFHILLPFYKLNLT